MTRSITKTKTRRVTVGTRADSDGEHEIVTATPFIRRMWLTLAEMRRIVAACEKVKP